MLKARKRLKQREIQEDNLSVYYRKGSEFLKKHSRNLQIGFGAVVVVLVVLMLMARSKRDAEIVASSQLGVVQNYFFQGQYSAALADLQEISNTFSGTRSAGKAVFYMARIYLQRGDYHNAELQYKEYLNSYKDDPLYTAASLAGLAACLEHAESYEKAAEEYMRAWKIDRQSFAAPFYLENAALSYRQAGHNDDSREAYRSIIDLYPDASPASRAAYMVEML